MSLTWHIGDVRKVLATLDPGSVDLVLTSPPFLALRSYLPADHPDKASEIGAEASPGEFIDTLLDVVELCAEVLAPHGSLCFELGDTYAGSGGAGGDYGPDGLRDGQPKFRQTTPNTSFRLNDDGSVKHGKEHRINEAKNVGQLLPLPEGPGWPEAKSLCLIPELFRVALVYGRNPLTGRRTPRWRARNVIRWCRPNPPVGALGDKFRPGTSEMVVLCKSRTRYFDLDAVRVPHATGSDALRPREGNKSKEHGHYGGNSGSNPLGGPPLDWWEIPTQGYPGSHYATWPKALLLRPIKAMCPEKVCVTCGEASRRIVDVERLAPADDRQRKVQAGEYRLNGHDHPPEVGWQMQHTTLGWTDCGHADYRPGVVLDPFAGSGTTLDVAHGLGRSAIGIDLDGRNLLLAQDRLGMFGIDVVDHTEQVAS